MKSSENSSQTLLPLLFASEQTYGWSIGMRAITHTLLKEVELPPGAVVDLGCGGGALLAELGGRYTDRQLIGLDRHPLAVIQASKTTSGKALQADLAKLPLASESMALLLALDSFDQAGVDLRTAFKESWRVLCDNGILVVRVSAGSWLYGPHDVAFNTGQRYDRDSFVDALSSAGFQMLRDTRANLLMEAPVVVLRLLQKAGMVPLSNSLYANGVANWTMAALLSLESRYLVRHDLPHGLSMYVLARKE